MELLTALGLFFGGAVAGAALVCLMIVASDKIEDKTL